MSRNRSKGIAKENWGVEDIENYPIWREMMRECEERFDFIVFCDDGNAKNLFADFVFAIQKKFNRESGKIVEEINTAVDLAKQTMLSPKDKSKKEEFEVLFAKISQANTPSSYLLDLSEEKEKVKIIHDSQLTIIRMASEGNFPGNKIKSTAQAFIQQLDIWTTKNIYGICLYYMAHAARKYKRIYDNNTNSEKSNIKTCVSLASMEGLHNKLLTLFINPLKEYIKEICVLLNVALYFAEYSSDNFKSDAESIFNRYVCNDVPNSIAFDENDVLSGTKFRLTQEDKIQIKIITEQHQTFQTQNDNVLAKVSAVEISKINLDEDRKKQLYQEIEGNEPLRKAIIAAYQYLNVQRESCWSFLRHGEQGRKATQLFVETIITMEDKSLPSIQNQALMYIKAEGIYSTPYGEASGYHKTSRIGFILDSGILQNRENEIGITAKIKENFIMGQHGLFSRVTYKQRDDMDTRVELSHEQRETLLEQVKALPLTLLR